MPVLTDAQKAEIINQRLQQFEAEKFQHELNRETAVALADDQAVTQADQAIAVIDVAIGTHEAALADLES